MAQTKVVKGKQYVKTANGWRYSGEAKNTTKVMGKGDLKDMKTAGLKEKMKKAQEEARKKNRSKIKLPGF